jgi:serine O-acetyltransferase
MMYTNSRERRQQTVPDEVSLQVQSVEAGLGTTDTPASGLFALVASDIRAKAEWVYGSVSAKNMVKTVLTDGTFAMIVYRLMQCCQRLGLTPLAMIFGKLNVVFGRCIIGRHAQFGPGFALIHSFGVVINGSVRGGSNVKIEHLVTIGADRNMSPTLGDNIFLGAGAKIIGGIRIGSNVKIGANAVVVSDLPDGVTAVGVPAKIVRTGPSSIGASEG